MVSQLDWLEREEQYRRRISRLFFLCTTLAVVVVAILSFMHAVRKRETDVAKAQAAQEARIAAEDRERAAFVADSTAAAQRFEGFLTRYNAEPVPSTPIFRVPVLQGYNTNQFLGIVWPKYVRVVDPQASDEKIDLWHRNYYIRAMNKGPNDPRVVLLPAIEQKSTQLSMIPPTFTQITYAQTEVGIRTLEDTLATGLAANEPAAQDTTGSP